VMSESLALLKASTPSIEKKERFSSISKHGGKIKIEKERVYVKRDWSDDRLVEIPAEAITRAYEALNDLKNAELFTTTEVEW